MPRIDDAPERRIVRNLPLVTYIGYHRSPRRRDPIGLWHALPAAPQLSLLCRPLCTRPGFLSDRGAFTTPNEPFRRCVHARVYREHGRAIFYWHAHCDGDPACRVLRRRPRSGSPTMARRSENVRENVSRNGALVWPMLLAIIAHQAAPSGNSLRVFFDSSCTKVQVELLSAVRHVIQGGRKCVRDLIAAEYNFWVFRAVMLSLSVLFDFGFCRSPAS